MTTTQRIEDFEHKTQQILGETHLQSLDELLEHFMEAKDAQFYEFNRVNDCLQEIEDLQAQGQKMKAVTTSATESLGETASDDSVDDNEDDSDDSGSDSNGDISGDCSVSLADNDAERQACASLGKRVEKCSLKVMDYEREAVGLRQRMNEVQRALAEVSNSNFTPIHGNHHQE